jgi:hypothetical protein
MVYPRGNGGRIITFVVIPHCLFHCKYCGLPMLLPHEKLGRPFADPAFRSIDSLSVAVACSHCRHVGMYSLLANSPDRGPRDSVVSLAQNADCEFLRWLGCEEKNCKILLPVFAQWSAATSAGERQADIKTWVWDGLHCLAGHSISKPADL